MSLEIKGTAEEIAEFFTRTKEMSLFVSKGKSDDLIQEYIKILKVISNSSDLNSDVGQG